eukprot:5820384-Amphidinium_carterae.1
MCLAVHLAHDCQLCARLLRVGVAFFMCIVSLCTRPRLQEQLDKVRWLSDVASCWKPPARVLLLAQTGVEFALELHCKYLPCHDMQCWVEASDVFKRLGLSMLGGNVAKWLSQRWGAWETWL